jgi:hypothetical protein
MRIVIVSLRGIKISLFSSFCCETKLTCIEEKHIMADLGRGTDKEFPQTSRLLTFLGAWFRNRLVVHNSIDDFDGAHVPLALYDGVVITAHHTYFR